MSRIPSIFHSYGSLTGYFGPSEIIDKALSKQLRPVSTWRRWNARDMLPETGPGFRRASEFRDGLNLINSDSTGRSLCSVRYITYPGIAERNLSPAKFEMITCRSLPDLQTLNIFPGLTIIEDAVLIPCLEDECPDMIGTLLREMAYRTGGVIVLGKNWEPLVSEMDPYFDRVVQVYEMPVIRVQNYSKTVTPDYGQTTFSE